MNILGLEIPTGNYVNGKWIDGQGEELVVKNKYSQADLASFKELTEVEQVILSAQKGFKLLKAYSAGQRRELLESFIQVFQNYSEQAVELVIAEAGKPRGYAQVEVKRCQSTIADAIEESTRIAGEVIPMDFSIGEGKNAFTKLKGAGIVLAISPFNFPLNLALHKIAPAIAAGCPVILRPSPFTPISALLMAKVAEEAGWPGEIFQVINTPIPETQKLVEDERIRLLSFTGSDKVGWHLRDLAKQKHVLLELGGNAALYADQGSDVQMLAEKIANGAFLYGGQICISTQRVYAHADIYSELINAVAREMEKINVGDPAVEENLYGPLVDCVALERVDRWVKEDMEMGAKLVSGGKVLDTQKNIYAPTLLTDTNQQMHIHKNEFFAPVVSIDKVSDHKEAFSKINASHYGLQAGVFTENISVMKEAFNALEVGAVIINNVPGFRMDNMPYGGIKSSGLGREGAKYSIEAYSERLLCLF